ncbi:MAG: hypothetical protein KF749_08800 [Bacteroidetes bacterium]|nr:hypothetical protein [Bacteroidota bacterium]MCW5895895.1 hypothetical protein [Bacteroidota bacterium]
MRIILLAVALLIVPPFTAISQTGIPSAVIQGVHGQAISLSGDIGTYGELYSISGRDSRRPSSTARLFFRPTVSFYDAMTVSFNFLLSTEGSSRSATHQVNQINQFGIRPQWGWGYANAGDFTESFTPYTLNGIQIRGGGVAINPGLFRFSALGGYSRRGEGGGFDRYLYGGKVGVGRDSESYFDLIFVRTRDIPSRFQVFYPDSIPPPDSTQIGTAVNPYQETPQENLVVALAGALRMFDNALSLNGEVSGSAFTRDMHSTAFNNEKIPSIIKGLYTPRLSSSADYAYTLGMNVNLSQLGFRAGFRRIGPGYNSLGVSSLITDLSEVLLGVNVRFQQWATSFTWTRQNDNLLKQKINTTVRQTFGGNFSVRPLNEWNAGLFVNVLTMRNYAFSSPDFLWFTTFSIGTNHGIFFGREALVQTAAVNYIFQKSVDDNPIRAGHGLESHIVNLNSTFIPSPDWTIVPAVGITSSRVGLTPRTTIQTYSVTPQYRALENALAISLTIGLTSSTSVSSLLVNTTASYRVSPSNTITLVLRRMGFSSEEPVTGNYNEYVASLTVSQKL